MLKRLSKKSLALVKLALRKVRKLPLMAVIKQLGMMLTKSNRPQMAGDGYKIVHH